MNASTLPNTPDIALQQFSLTVEGMTCASCVSRVEKALKKLSGVQQASVNLATETATVHSIEGSVTAEQLLGAVQKVGYQATLATDSPVNQGNGNTHADSELVKLVCGIVLSLPLITPVFIQQQQPMLPNKTSSTAAKAACPTTLPKSLYPWVKAARQSALAPCSKWRTWPHPAAKATA